MIASSGLAGAPLVEGDAVTLREALRNLIDNALKYAGGGQPIEVRVARAKDGAVLRVEIADRGPGIPAEEKRIVLERFGRGRSAGGVIGSGLGLAIVEAVADAHGARLDLLDRPGGGLIVRLDLPALEQPKRGGGAAGHLRPALALALVPTLLYAAPAEAAEVLVYPAPGAESERLRIHGATDLSAMEPLLRDFQEIWPGVAIEYVDLLTNELYASVAEATAATAPDLAISSAMDLQAKLVNDGHARPHRSAITRALPGWANWRDEAFGFTYEPAVMVYHRDLVPEAEVPRSRFDLVRLLRERPERYRGRVATYDVGESGVGYLFAAHDALLSSEFWQLVASFGETGAQTFCCTADVLDAVERGEALIGYNVLGSYARARELAGAPIGVVLPSDYTLVMLRVALIPRRAGNPGLAGRFVDYMLSSRGQGVIADRALLYAISPLVTGTTTAASLMAEATGPLQPIAIGPALLVFLDRAKKERFLADWRRAIQPRHESLVRSGLGSGPEPEPSAGPPD